MKGSVVTAPISASPCPSCSSLWSDEVAIIPYFSPSARDSSPPQRQRLIRARVSPEDGGAAGEESSGADGTAGDSDTQPREEVGGKEVAGVTGGGAQQKDEVENEEGEEEGEEEEEEAPFKPFVLPGEWRKKNRGLQSTNHYGFEKDQ